ncbi:GTP-binding protein [Pantoea sp. GbtcB22]|uniref:CobW family GTP-binding protein n=1 Tax=Pantoea sp. GbtcB22 TaxID=2824767 RepID=UPI001C30D80E
MNSIPVTILNGFLGAGKTTLLKSLLVQAHKQGLSVCVIVNDMSELDIDGVLVANTEIVGPEHHNFVALSADSISSKTGINKLDSGLTTLLQNQTPDLILIETSGSSHPLPLIRYFRNHERVSLRAVVSLADAIMLNEDYDAGKSLIPRFKKNLQEGKRGVENLLAEQIMFCSHLLLTKNDRLPLSNVTEIAKAIHSLNPYVSVKAVQWGNLDINVLLEAIDYNFERVSLLIEELQDEIDVPSYQMESGAYNITSRVISDDRPFHPQRLWNVYHEFLSPGIHRSKGFFWLPGRDDLALLWNQASGSISLEFISFWKAGVLNHENNSLTQEERQVLKQQLSSMPGRFGDRQCSLTVIGQYEEVDPFVEALQQCFLTEDEIDAWKKGATFPDPWPHKVARLKN